MGKFPILISKFQTISNNQNRKELNDLEFEIWNLFRI